MNHPKVLQIIDEADQVLDRLGHDFESGNHRNIDELVSDIFAMVEEIRTLTYAEIPPDDIDKTKLFEVIHSAFPVIDNLRVAVHTKNKDKFNAEFYLLSFILDDMIEIIIEEDKPRD